MVSPSSLVAPRPERRSRRVDPPERLFVERPRRRARRVDGREAPAVDHEPDVAIQRMPGAEGGPALEEFDIRVLRRDEGQGAVVEHRVDDNRADHPRDARFADAQAAARVQQPALLGAERRHLFEHLPLAAGFLPALPRLGVLGQIQGEAAGDRARLVVELDRRGQAVGGQVGLRPDQKGVFRRDLARGRRRLRPDQVDQAGHGVDLIHGPPDGGLYFVPLTDGLGRQLRFHDLAPGLVSLVGGSGMEGHRGQCQSQEHRQQGRRLGRVPPPSQQPGGPPPERGREQRRRQQDPCRIGPGDVAGPPQPHHRRQGPRRDQAGLFRARGADPPPRRGETQHGNGPPDRGGMHADEPRGDGHPGPVPRVHGVAEPVDAGHRGERVAKTEVPGEQGCRGRAGGQVGEPERDRAPPGVRPARPWPAASQASAVSSGR